MEFMTVCSNPRLGSCMLRKFHLGGTRQVLLKRTIWKEDEKMSEPDIFLFSSHIVHFFNNLSSTLHVLSKSTIIGGKEGSVCPNLLDSLPI